MENVEFRLGEIEHLPVEDNSIDVVISNCVINLSVDKERVVQEIHRVLKPGGRIAISDIALRKELPEATRTSIAAYVGCVGGAVLVDVYRKIIEAAGFRDVSVAVTGPSSCITPDARDPIGSAIVDAVGTDSLQDYVVSVSVQGRK